MRKLILLLFPLSSAFAQEVITETVPTPAALKDGRIHVMTLDGQSYDFSENDYMVVPRIKRTKVVTKTVTQPAVVQVREAPKNEIMLGARHDYTGVDKSVTATSADIKVQKGAVLDLGYMRHNLLGSKINGGLGVDTNGTPKVMLGLDF